MKKKWLAMLMSFALAFGALGFVSMDHVDAKGYKSGKRSYTPSQSERVTPSKSYKSDSKTTYNAPTKPKSKFGSFAKGLLLGGLGGLLLGSVFGGLGPIGTGLAFLVNMMLFVGIVMMAVKLFRSFKKKRKEQTTWRQ